MRRQLAQGLALAAALWAASEAAQIALGAWWLS